ncbi:methyl-accepting chemotaxis protein [Erwinia sorbitola]|uniref:HAMP domain-containing protein n=1 Tax=Erwinia sorbitola TaxID=2681984 RepID=A0ABW9RFH7_9GAMM|nr:methyl-accepting chemotaxis protein [Erwinia sorbitola]MTD28746.1 HAMP domain-containing protein [Erwinia sorbitola]
MNITKRLLLAFSLLIFSLIVTNVISMYSLSNISRDAKYFQENSLPSIILINDEMKKVTDIRSQLYLHGLTEDPAEMTEVKNKSLALYSELLGMHHHYLNDLTSDENDLSQSKKTQADLEKFGEVMTQYFKISESNDRVAIAKAMQNGGLVAGQISQLVDDFKVQVAYNNQLVTEANLKSGRLINNSMTLSAVATLLATLVLGAFAIMTVLNIKRRLNSMTKGIVSISETLDLSQSLTTGRQDEIGLTVSAFNQLVARVAEAMQMVRGASHSVSESADDISKGNDELSARTEQQSAAVVETAASMEELSSTVKQNADNAQLASQLAATAADTALSGGSVVGAAVLRMKDISESSRRIADITSVINGIAFQTNILALNAAVEAARAGDQGRGFAVVAAEVRSLAQRSAQAAKEIETLIASSVKQVEEGVQQVDLAGERMSGIVNSVTQVKVLMQEIAAASDEQNRGIAQIALAMTEMDTTTQHNATLVQASSAAASSLEDQSTKLQKMVDIFRLPGSNNPAVTAKVKTPKARLAGAAASSASWESF